MTGTTSTLHNCVKRRKRELTCVGLGIHLLYRRGKGYRSTNLLKQTVAANIPYAQEHNPKLFFHAIYTPEEEEENGDSLPQLKSYVKEARAKFCAGELDPNNDADWNAYVDRLERLGLSTIIRNTQSAVNRMEGK